MNTPRVGLLADFYALYRDDPDYSEFVAHFNAGLATAWCYTAGAVTPTDYGLALIEVAWEGFCDEFSIEDARLFTRMSDVLSYQYGMDEECVVA